MIACSPSTAKIYRRAYGTVTSTLDEADGTTNVTVVVASDGWQEISSEEFVYEAVTVEEYPEKTPDEPNTGERPVYQERPHRRLATVTATRRRPRQLASSFG